MRLKVRLTTGSFFLLQVPGGKKRETTQVQRDLFAMQAHVAGSAKSVETREAIGHFRDLSVRAKTYLANEVAAGSVASLTQEARFGCVCCSKIRHDFVSSLTPVSLPPSSSNEKRLYFGRKQESFSGQSWRRKPHECRSAAGISLCGSAAGNRDGSAGGPGAEAGGASSPYGHGGAATDARRD